MGKKMGIEEKIVTVVLLAVVLAGCVMGRAYSYADELISSVGREVGIIKEEMPAYEVTVQSFLSDLPFKQCLINLNGNLAKNLGLREIYQKKGGIVMENGYVAGIYSLTTTDYEIEQIAALKDFLDERGIQLLYVNEPTKYFNDDVVKNELGRYTFVNSNTDRFLERLDDIGVHYIDLRENYSAMGLDSFDFFYKTDHHWTVPAGKIAAEAIAAELNAYYGYHIDLSLYDDNRFAVTHYENAWLGEQGKKLGVSFVGMDDFDLVLPDYATDYTVYYMNGSIMQGSFGEALVNQEIFMPENNLDVYGATSWHYSYMPEGVIESTVVNHGNTEGKRVLVLGDSYEQITVPFLSLGISEIQTLVLRDFDESLEEYIDSRDIDTVIIAYASFMIGAHDNEASANYNMFHFR